MYTAEQVQEDFLSAEERLLNEAKSLVATPRIDAMKKAERLNKLGFTSSKDSKFAEDVAQKSVRANDLMSTIAYFRTYYPMNKFITDEEVKKLCEKYGLVLGGADRYIGNIPEKNITQMEAFKVRKEDYVEEAEGLEAAMRQLTERMFRPMEMGFGLDMLGNQRVIRSGWPSMIMDNDAPTQKKSTKKPGFKMCAPAKEFDTSRMIVSEGYKLVVDDPIVLQPVKGGYLIVTAWGLEASDDMVKNEIEN